MWYIAVVARRRGHGQTLNPAQTPGNSYARLTSQDHQLSQGHLENVPISLHLDWTYFVKSPIFKCRGVCWIIYAQKQQLSACRRVGEDWLKFHSSDLNAMNAVVCASRAAGFTHCWSTGVFSTSQPSAGFAEAGPCECVCVCVFISTHTSLRWWS